MRRRLTGGVITVFYTLVLQVLNITPENKVFKSEF
jgi:hypothetical protein